MCWSVWLQLVGWVWYIPHSATRDLYVKPIIPIQIHSAPLWLNAVYTHTGRPEVLLWGYFRSWQWLCYWKRALWHFCIGKHRPSTCHACTEVIQDCVIGLDLWETAGIGWERQLLSAPVFSAETLFCSVGDKTSGLSSFAVLSGRLHLIFLLLLRV